VLWWLVIGVLAGFVAGRRLPPLRRRQRSLRWVVTMSYGSHDDVRVCVRKGGDGQRLLVGRPLALGRSDFEELLMERVGEARAKAVALNVAEGSGR
jgi:hypothetical protein